MSVVSASQSRPTLAGSTAATVFTIADASYFVGVVGLVNSLRLTGNPYEIVVIDCGLEEWQRALLARETRVVPLPDTSIASPYLWKSLVASLDPVAVVLWVDSDILVTRPLADVVAIAREGRICVVRDDWDTGVERFFPEWEELFDLHAPCRRQTYVNAGFFALDVAQFPTLLERWAECCRRIPPHGILIGEHTTDPLWAGDQDALNALLMSEVPVGKVACLPAAEMVHARGMSRVRVVDAATLAVVEQDVHPRLLHYTWRPKPWQTGAWRRVKPDAYVTLLIRSLFGDGATISIPVAVVPRWLRPGRPGRASLFLVRAARKSIVLSGRMWRTLARAARGF